MVTAVMMSTAVF